MQSKSDIVRQLVKVGAMKQALRITKDFRLGITNQQSEVLKMAYECLVHPQFYKELGIDTEKKVKDGKKLIFSLYGRENE